MHEGFYCMLVQLDESVRVTVSAISQSRQAAKSIRRIRQQRTDTSRRCPRQGCGARAGAAQQIKFVIPGSHAAKPMASSHPHPQLWAPSNFTWSSSVISHTHTLSCAQAQPLSALAVLAKPLTLTFAHSHGGSGSSSEPRQAAAAAYPCSLSPRLGLPELALLLGRLR